MKSNLPNPQQTQIRALTQRQVHTFIELKVYLKGTVVFSNLGPIANWKKDIL